MSFKDKRKFTVETIGRFTVLSRVGKNHDDEWTWHVIVRDSPEAIQVVCEYGYKTKSREEAELIRMTFVDAFYTGCTGKMRKG